MKHIFIITAILISSLSFTATAQTDALRQQIIQVIKTKKATVGISVYGLETGDTLGINAETHFPLQSVFKFHIALTVLDLVDKGKLSLNQHVFIKRSDLLPNTWSPLRDDNPTGNIKLTLDKILSYTVSQSDNNGCDILLRLIGGPVTVNNYLKQIGMRDVSIHVNEEQMHKEWNAQFSNWTTPTSSTTLLRMFYDGKVLTKNTRGYLWKIMTETTTGTDRIKGLLPTGTIVAHKTGTSGTRQGIAAAVNDIGIITLPNGQHFALGVFVTNSTENDKTNAQIIAAIAKQCWDYFAGKTK